MGLFYFFDEVKCVEQGQAVCVRLPFLDYRIKHFLVLLSRETHIYVDPPTLQADPCPDGGEPYHRLGCKF